MPEIYKDFERSNSVLLMLEEKTKEGLPIGIWFTKGHSNKTNSDYIRIQRTFLYEGKEGLKREWVRPPTFCTPEELDSFIEALTTMRCRRRA